MNHLFYKDDDENMQLKVNMDELYEEKQKKDLNKVETYNKLLARIHIKIKTVSRQRIDNQWCWYLMPEVLIGSPNYNFSDCLSYIIYQLQENGFVVKYTHPNLLFISWKHWVPSYVRNELKKKTGLVVDGYGNKIQSKKEENVNDLLKNKSSTNNDNKPNFKPIHSYKPSGNSIYNSDLLNTSIKK
tara:strand:+ start:2956 stop:3513 length:558 start_codon:yes stop_codon:yes gene_type:complete